MPIKQGYYNNLRILVEVCCWLAAAWR